MSERRIYPRVPLDAPIFVHVAVGALPMQTMILVDISSGGAQFTFPPTVETAGDWLGKVVVMSGFPQVIAKESLEGLVSWVSPERCGVKFNEVLALDEDGLQEAIAMLA